MPILRWKQDNRQYSNAQLLFVGPWCVGSVTHNPNRPKGVTADWRASCQLPGVTPNVGHYPSAELGKQEVEKLVTLWLNKATEQEASVVACVRP